jgi:hypothetical protein
MCVNWKNWKNQEICVDQDILISQDKTFTRLCLLNLFIKK